MSVFPFPISVAPMMDWTDRHCRYFHRLLAPHAQLYTEMVVSGAILHGDQARFLRFDAAEHPVVLQLGGSDPEELAEAARIGATYGYDEINLNCGCPSDRVQKGRFGACLMAEPQLVAECVGAMQSAVNIPVTVKTRIGIDDHDDESFLHAFVERLRATGCKAFIIHARKAWLQGLSPKQNREVPPLRYDVVYRLKQRFPDCTIILNGGLRTMEAVLAQEGHVDGVMLGRIAYQSPEILNTLERHYHGTAPDVMESLTQYTAYIMQEQANGTPLPPMLKPLLGLFQGRKGARHWRRTLSEARSGTGEMVIEKALSDIKRFGFQ